MEIYRIKPSTNWYNAKVLGTSYGADKTIIFAYSYSRSLKYAVIKKDDGEDLKKGMDTLLPHLKELGIGGPSHIKDMRKLEGTLEVPAGQGKTIEAILQVGIRAAKLYWLRECPEVRESKSKWVPKWLRPCPELLLSKKISK